ncbi:MAG: PilC/PilY family type IV pilus protein [Pseudomonadota bacterium]|nr:PilC/PilY family type IV pilus protein [Pseudomonadota bacterium]
MSKYLVISVLLCSIKPSVHAAELDYLFADTIKKNETNILFILDASTSLNEPYLYHVSLTNPYTNPSSWDVIGLNVVRDTVQSALKNSDIIAPSTTYSTDTLHCPPEYLTILGEGIYADCPIPLQDRWYLRRIDLVRDIVNDSLPLLIGSNVGFMRTGLNNKSFVPYAESGFPTGINRRTGFPDYTRESNGAYVIQAMKPIDTLEDVIATANRLNSTYLKNVEWSSQSPLAESLYDAYIYFTGQTSPWTKSYLTGWPSEHLNDIDPNAYSSGNINSAHAPILSECSSNHIIVMSDGVPTYDWHANSYIQALTGATPTPPVPSPDTDETEDSLPEHTLLDELAGYLANTDLAPSMPGNQSISTHFISTWAAEFATSEEANNLLDAAAAASGGFHEAIKDINELHAALSSLLTKIENSNNTLAGFSFTTSSDTGNPLKPISSTYINSWEYNNGQWLGNLKKYNVTKSGIFKDANNKNVFNKDGSINTKTQSLWSSLTDGENAIQGGAAAQLSDAGANRYTIPRRALKPNTQIRQKQFIISAQNNALNIEDLNTNTDAQRELYLNWASGIDTQDIDNDGVVTDLRNNLGDQVNTSPVVAHYADENSSSPVVFTATNEGYLHAIDGDTGRHIYSFMPPEALESVDKLMQSQVNKFYGIDGQMRLWHNDLNHDFNLLSSSNSIDSNEKLMLFFGLGRGGSSYYALDITNREDPKLAWAINQETEGFNQLGETWSTIITTNIKTAAGTPKTVSLFGGGLSAKLRDSGQSDNMGNAVYIVDTETGTLLWRISNSNSDINIKEMQNSIVSSPVLIDYNKDGLSDAFFINDIRGQIFRCDFSSELNSELSCGTIAQLQEKNEDLYFMTDLDISFIGGTDQYPHRKLVLSLSSGNKFKPIDPDASNRIAVIFDSYTNSAPANYNYIGNSPITLNDLTSATYESVEPSDYGWYFNLSKPGEKSFAQTLTFDHKLFASTYLPSEASTNCNSLDVGTANLYGFSIFDGTPIPVSKNEHLLWSGPTQLLPQTPYMVVTEEKNEVQGALHIGVNDADISFIVDPVKRTYWYQR